MSFIEEMLAKKRQGADAFCPDGYKASDNDVDPLSDLGTLTLSENTRIYGAMADAVTEPGDTDVPEKDAAEPKELTFDDVCVEILQITKKKIRTPSQSQISPVNIWDIDLDDDAEIPLYEKPLYETDLYDADQPIDEPKEPEMVVPPVAPAATSSTKRKPSRGKTRAQADEPPANAVVDLFNPDVAVVQSTRPKFPVGWLVVVDGPGRGTFFTLMSGMSQIGRGGDQTIQLNFGDEEISQDNHAVIAYDTEQHEFLLGHGGRSKIVRLNDRLVLSTESLKNADQIRIGETTLKLVVLCDEKFSWEADKAQGDGHEAIA